MDRHPCVSFPAPNLAPVATWQEAAIPPQLSFNDDNWIKWTQKKRSAHRRHQQQYHFSDSYIEEKNFNEGEEESRDDCACNDLLADRPLDPKIEFHMTIGANKRPRDKITNEN